jgi:integrase
MPRRASPPRLWLRPARRDKSGRVTHQEAYVILDHGRQIVVGGDIHEAEQALQRYLGQKHSAGIAHRGVRETDGILVADVITLYAQDVVPQHARASDTANRFYRLLDFFGAKSLADMNGRLCRDYAKHVGADTTARRDLEDLRAAINHHRREGLHDRIVSVVLPPPRPARERWLSRDEAARLIWTLWRNRATRHVARFVLIALYTGRRSSVVTGASFKRENGRTWLDTRSGFLWPPERAKVTKKRNPPIPLPDRLLAHLRRWERHGARYAVQYQGRTINRVDRPVRAAAAEAGLGLVTPHCLRHSAATWQMQAGTDMFEASKYLGMTLQTLQSTYGHFRPEHLTGARDAYKRLNRRPPTIANDTSEPIGNDMATFGAEKRDVASKGPVSQS